LISNEIETAAETRIEDGRKRFVFYDDVMLSPTSSGGFLSLKLM